MDDRTAIFILVTLLPLTAFHIQPAGATGLPSLQASPTQPTISVWNPTHHSGNITDPSLRISSEFTVSVNITGAPELDTYSFNLRYHPRILDLVGASLNGTIFWNRTICCTPMVPENGTISVFVIGAGTFVGSGTLLYARFRVLTISLSNLSITDSTLSLRTVPIAHQDRWGCFSNRIPKTPTIDFSTSPAPNYYETSLYMTGKIAVGIILAQGPKYNWTDEEVSLTITMIKSAMNWWVSQSPYAKLSFYYDIHIRVPTSPYEPRDLSMSQSPLWITQALNTLGYSGNSYDAGRAYVNDIRSRYQTDWAFAAFVAGQFSGFEYGYAFIGGPYLVLSRQDMAVAAHETAHIFGATDEYNYVQETSGYYYVPDADGQTGLMNAANLILPASTEAQVGLVDCDGNGVMDTLDPQPAIRLDPINTTVTQPIVTVTGKARAVPAPTYRPFGRDVTIGTIASVEYTIDQGASATAKPTDGAFDSPLEGFSFNLTQLPPGKHTIQVKATNSVGNAGVSTFQVDVPSTAEFVGWEVRPLHHFDLTESPQQVFEADIGVEGIPTHVYIQFRVTRENGPTYIVISDILKLNPGTQAIIQTRWTAPSLSARYQVTATLYYSPWLTPPGSLSWSNGGVKEFSFNVGA